MRPPTHASTPTLRTLLALLAVGAFVAGCATRAAGPEASAEHATAGETGTVADDHGQAEDAHAHDDHHDEDKGDGGYIGDAEGPFERGAPLSIAADEAVALSAVVADPAVFADQVVRVEGRAASVCERRGCWFVIEADDVDEPVRVRFLDYAFFIPKDAAGRKVSLEATVEVRTLTPERQVHYAEHVGETLDPEGLEDRDEVTLIARGLVVH